MLPGSVTCALQASLIEICSKVWPLNVAAGASPSAERHFFYSPTCSGIGGWISQVLLSLASFDPAAISPQFFDNFCRYPTWSQYCLEDCQDDDDSWRGGYGSSKGCTLQVIGTMNITQQKGDKGIQCGDK